MRLNNLFLSVIVLLPASSFAEDKPHSSWDIISASSDAAYYQVATEEAKARQEYNKVRDDLRPSAASGDYITLEQFQAALKELSASKATGKPVTLKVPESKKPKPPRFNWQLVSLGQISGKPSIELKKNGGVEVRTVFTGDSVDGWSVEIEGSTVKVVNGNVVKHL